MNIKEFDEELNRLEKELKSIHENTDMQNETTKFLANEASKLMIEAESPDLSEEKKTELYKKIQALDLRFKKEIQIVEEDFIKLDAMELRAAELRKIIEDKTKK